MVPGRASRSRAASAPAGATSAFQRWPVQLSHRPQRGRLGVVELPAQELHPARVRGLVREHRLLLAGPLARHPLVPLAVVLPRLAGGHPAARGAGHRAVHVEHLEHRLEAPPGQVDPGLDGGGGQRPARVRERVDRRADLLLGREGERGEVRPDVAVLAAGQQDDLGPLDAAPGPADLLVVGDRRLRRAEVHDEAEVGLVEPHAEGAGRDQRLDPVGEQVLLRLQPRGLIVLAAVGGDLDALLAQERGRLVGGGDRQRVDDPRVRQRVAAEGVGQPGQPHRGGRQADHGQPERLAVERPAQHQHAAAIVGAAQAGLKLLGHVGRDPGVGGRGGRQHRYVRRQGLEQGPDPAVVGPEVVPPVGDAVRLVDHDQPGRRGQLRQHVVAEPGVVEPLGADQQHVDRAVADLRVDLLPVVEVGGVDRARVDARPRRRLDLVPHQRQQRRDDHGRARPGRAQQRGRDEVDRRLAPPGPLHHQRPPLLGHQGADRRPLVLAQPRVLARQRP